MMSVHKILIRTDNCDCCPTEMNFFTILGRYRQIRMKINDEIILVEGGGGRLGLDSILNGRLGGRGLDLYYGH